MDYAAASDKIGAATKTARRFSAERINQATAAADAIAPLFAPFAARWDTEADRRKQLRTPENLKKLMEAQRRHNSARSTAAAARSQRAVARKSNSNPLSAARRSAATVDRAAGKQAAESRRKLREAKRNYPATLASVAVRAHAGHTIPAALASYAMSTPADWTMWPGATSAALIAANVGALWLGRRKAASEVPDGLSAEERRLAQRLDPSYWVQYADERGLEGTVPTPADLTPAGLVSHVRLDGRWTPKTFRAKADEIRALLGARSDLRMEIVSGSHGDRATITLRTRSAADGVDLTGWAPGAPWGVDTVTGEPVMVPLGRRMLIAGTSGSGKSWSTRALLAEASEASDQRLVVIDPKRVEAINWQHRARIAITPEEVLEVTDELVAEMHERLELVPRGRDTIEVTPQRPRITVFVDEGAEVIAMSKTPRRKGSEDGPGDPDWSRIMSNLRTLARMARAAEIPLIWATQKPTMDEKTGGIDSQVAGQITYRAALALSTSSEARVVFGEDATDRGWHAHELPMPGVAMLRSGPKAKPHQINTRAFSPADVIALPDRPVWHRTTQAGTEEPCSLRLVKDGTAQAPASREAVESSNRGRVAAAVRDGARTPKAVAQATGLNKGTVSRELRALVKDGAVRRGDDGTLTTGREEAA
ncbi:FtsK/SpoIIIE domain-containing protein [Streptomyces sp. AA1529]|uniref:FtsK/SpoIIIE domain-containing protein n=1 Tax=Streptomyces sp. AA1529 TaxID=1203257 RepID=UPI003D72BD7A